MPPEIPIPPTPVLMLDYDGTLAPFALDPGKAFPHPEVPRLLKRLSNLIPVYIVTGRLLEDLPQLLPLPLPAFGVHGAQYGIIGQRASVEVSIEVRKSIEQWQASLDVIPGIRIEDKIAAVVLHYRDAPNEADVLPWLHQVEAALPGGLQGLWGKKVLEVRPSALNKGVAVKRILEVHPDRTPIYIGDDQSDEEAFRVLTVEAVTVRVGDGPTEAGYTIPDIESVVALLRRIADRVS